MNGLCYVIIYDMNIIIEIKEKYSFSIFENSYIPNVVDVNDLLIILSERGCFCKYSSSF